uniref:Coiled-coil domain containing 24 n=1 Tax=Cynoglossus semilaevis TaxID=244447 RepID=A0A3P8VXR7_CYNSE
MQSLDENQFWCHDPGPSLWALIVKHVPGSELPNICTALGHFLVDMYTEVHTEAEMWYSMWQDSQQSGYHSSREATSISSLPDPPVIKELLRAEVKMLLQSLEERASSRGGDGAELLLKYKPETVNYVLSHRNNFNSNGVNSENAADGSRPSSHCSFRSCAEEEIEAVRDKINVSDIDQVVDRLKSVLMEECEALNKMVQSFKVSIKENCRSQRKLEKRELSLLELRELRGTIQTDLDSFSSLLETTPQPIWEKDLKNKLRLPVGPKALDQILSSMDIRPHPPSALLYPEPRQTPLTNTSVSFTPIHAPSSSRTQSQHSITLNKLKRITGFTTFTSSRQAPPNCIDDKSKSYCSLSHMYITADLPCSPQSSHTDFQVKSQENSSFPGVGPTSNNCIHHSSTAFDPSCMEKDSCRKLSTVFSWKGRIPNR